MSNIRKGDTVEVIAGKDKGVTGKVLDIVQGTRHQIVNRDDPVPLRQQEVDQMRS